MFLFFLVKDQMNVLAMQARVPEAGERQRDLFLFYYFKKVTGNHQPLKFTLINSKKGLATIIACVTGLGLSQDSIERNIFNICFMYIALP